MKIAQNYKIWFAISAAVIIIGMVMGFTSGFNLGIDFTGGTIMQFDVARQFTVDEMTEALKEFELDPTIVHAGKTNTEVIIKTKKDLNNEARKEVLAVLQEKFNKEAKTFLKTDQFGPSIGKEISNKALLSIGIAAVGMLIYISFRFYFRFGVAAILALVHDVLVVLSVYAVFRIPVNSPFIAAILTIVGYSINDTIVVFDRLRENLKYKKRKDTYFEVADKSIKQTLTRSINTSITTLLVIGCLYFLGVDSIREFTLPLLAGVFTGTYSSIFIASPIWALSMQVVKER